AGAAGLIKAALALHHKILPPTINVTQPAPQLDIETSAFYVNTESRPWIRATDAPPRRAGVSAFGFGGTNVHIVLEEYARDHNAPYRRHNVTQSVLLSAPTPEQLLRQGNATLQALTSADSAQAYAQLVAQSGEPVASQAARLGFVADSLDEAREMLNVGVATLEKRLNTETWEHPRGIYYRAEGLACEGRVVALFPGQGSQYVNMGREIALNFPPLREMYAAMDTLFIREGLEPLSKVVFPIPAFDEAGEKAQAKALRRTEYAQAAIGVFSAALYQILTQAGFQPDFTAGHSFGELAALWAGGVVSDEDFLALVKARGKAMTLPPEASSDVGGMLAVQAPLAEIEQAIVDFPEVIIANVNAPTQVVLAGPTAAIAQAQTGLKAKGYNVAALPVAAAFHTPLVGYASEPFARAVAPVMFHAARVPVYSNTTGRPYPADADAAKQVLAQHILHPVIFKTQIENIYASGGNIFVEIGPRRVVTNLVDDILGDRPHIAVALNSSRQKSSDRQLREAVVQLRVAGLPLRDIDPYGDS
ncbi:MAG: acyltransferase domain-containing protein, partial [Anaerolineae bacterium]